MAGAACRLILRLGLPPGVTPLPHSKLFTGMLPVTRAVLDNLTRKVVSLMKPSIIPWHQGAEDHRGHGASACAPKGSHAHLWIISRLRVPVHSQEAGTWLTDLQVWCSTKEDCRYLASAHARQPWL